MASSSTPVVQRRTQMASSSTPVQRPTLLPVETFLSVLEHLKTKVYTSSRLARHQSIRKLIAALEEVRVRLPPFCDDLHLRISRFMATLTPTERKGSVSFMPKFQIFRSTDVPGIWQTHLRAIIPDLELDPILIQRATLEYTLLVLKSFNGTTTASTASLPKKTSEKSERQSIMTLEEQNAIRYAAGYVVRKFKKRYEKEGPVEVVQCLLSMEEGSEMDQDSGADYSYQDYTRIWVNLVDRCGLFKVNDDTYLFFLELELSMYPMLRATIESSTPCQKDNVLQHILRDEDVLFAWALLSVHLDNVNSQKLLSEILLHWIQIRGFSIVSMLLEDYKAATRTQTKAKKSLRKHLKDM